MMEFVKICIALQFFFQVCGNFAYLHTNFAADIDYCGIKNKMSMDRDKVLRWLTIFAGPIGWSITSFYCAVLLRRQYCEIRRNRKQITK